MLLQWPRGIFLQTIQAAAFKLETPGTATKVTSSDHVPGDNTHKKLLYKTFKINSKLKDMKITALLDSGSEVNLISDNLYRKLPQDSVTPINSANGTSIKVASGDIVCVLGTCSLKVQHHKKGNKSILCYVLTTLSHPLILGLDYLIENKIILDFAQCTHYSNNSAIKLTQTITIPPRKEMYISSTLPRAIPIGTQGICVASKLVTNKGLLGARVLVTKQPHKCAPLRLYNPTDFPIQLYKGAKIATFMPCGNDTVFHNFNSNSACKATNPDVGTFDEFINNFDLKDLSHLSADQISSLKRLLYDNKDVFVTKEDPSLGLSNVVKHTIKLKHDYHEKHMRPYRLTPEKREVLRFHLDELQKQGIISLVQPNEHTIITSPIVLVEKRKPPNKNDPTLSH